MINKALSIAVSLMSALLLMATMNRLAFAADAAPAAAPGDAAPSAASDRYVFLITIDGFAAYLLNDPDVRLPTLRKLAAEGAASEGLRPVNPTITWPNHTTLITGVRPDRHGVLFNGVMHRQEAGRPTHLEPVVTQKQLTSVLTLFEAAKAKGLRTAAIDWPCTSGSESIDDNMPDVQGQMNFTTPRLVRDVVSLGSMTTGSQEEFVAMSGAARDQMFSDAACHLVRSRKPQLMAYHLLNTDAIHHRYGPGSPASYTALALADKFIGELLRAMDDAGIRDRSTLLVMADHGFAIAKRQVLPNVILRKAGWLTVAPTTAILRAKAHAVAEGGTCCVYLDDPATRAADSKAVAELLSKQKGIRAVVTPDHFAEYHLPTPTQTEQSPDLWLIADDFYAFSSIATGDDELVETDNKQRTMGNHGYVNTDPKMLAIFLAWGSGIRPGSKLGIVDNVDVAPTVSKLLGLQMPPMEGKPLDTMLLAGSK